MKDLKQSIERLNVLDVLRGFALFGLLIPHVTVNYLSKDNIIPAATYSMTDKMLTLVVQNLLLGKFYIIFSFLFGYGFVIQMQSAKAKGVPFTGRFIWRLITLFMIGTLHSFFFRGDILQVYAVLGFFLLLLRNWEEKKISRLFVVLFIVNLIVVMSFPGIQRLLQLPLAYWKVAQLINVGGFVEKMLYQVTSGRLLTTASAFLLGLLAGKRDIFRKGSAVFSVRAIVWSFGIALSNTAILGLINFSDVEHGPHSNYFVSLSDAVRQVQRFALAFFYFSFVVQIYNSKLHKVLSFFEPVGKMGLTSYLMQSVFIVSVLSFGIEFLITAGMTGLLLMSIIFFILQILFARLWFVFFISGPVEWIWRSAILLQWQPILKGSGKKRRSS